MNAAAPQCAGGWVVDALHQNVRKGMRSGVWVADDRGSVPRPTVCGPPVLVQGRHRGWARGLEEEGCWGLWTGLLSALIRSVSVWRHFIAERRWSVRCGGYGHCCSVCGPEGVVGGLDLGGGGGRTVLFVLHSHAQGHCRLGGFPRHYARHGPCAALSLGRLHCRNVALWRPLGGGGGTPRVGFPGTRPVRYVGGEGGGRHLLFPGLYKALLEPLPSPFLFVVCADRLVCARTTARTSFGVAIKASYAGCTGRISCPCQKYLAW